jgi:hypothetical protein
MGFFEGGRAAACGIDGGGWGRGAILMDGVGHVVVALEWK